MEIKDDISKFCRKLRLAEKFYDKGDEDESLVRNKSDYNPPKGRNISLDKFCEHITNFPYHNIPKSKTKPNINHVQWEVIYKLKNDPNIIIKEADKGSAVVLMDKDFYKHLALSMLEDRQYYEKVPNYNQRRVMQQLQVLIHLYHKSLTSKECDYLTNFKCKTSIFLVYQKNIKAN